jgi:hypothetical protein
VLSLLLHLLYLIFNIETLVTNSMNLLIKTTISFFFFLGKIDNINGIKIHLCL